MFIYSKECHSSFHLYNTEIVNDNDQIEHDCLFYQVLDDIVEYMDENSFSHPYEVVAYCIRPLEREAYSNKIPVGLLTNVTFETLRRDNVTSLQLLDWSAPIDLVERYQNYLNAPTGKSASEIYYKCPPFQFGQFCQYEFPWNGHFSNIVRIAFEIKSPVFYVTDERSCFSHLECVHHALYACLDWREVCDGNSDCKDGIDEQDCFLLDLTICTSGEYQCQNGMCIPGEFFDDNSLNPDCIDGTDEINSGKTDYYADRCYQDPSFRCEERTRIRGVGFSCGDGQFLNRIEIPLPLIPTCHNGREFIHYQDYQGSINTDESIAFCWLGVSCLLSQIQLSWISKRYSDPDNDQRDPCYEFTGKTCSYSYVTSRLVWGGHIYLVYDAYTSDLLPSQICYDKNYCHFSHHNSINNKSCQLTRTTHWLDVIYEINSFLHNCTDIFSSKNQFDCDAKLAYHCLNSSTCIPRFKLADGILDCPFGDDEQTAESCRLNDQYRFRCLSEEKCLSAWLVLDGKKDCAYAEDERIPGEKKLGMPFTYLCNQKIDIPHSTIYFNEHNDTDETDCEQWSCENQFSRCDGQWHCLDGADEAGCPDSPCEADELLCISIYEPELICLPLSYVGDNITDCLGSYDERDFCRSLKPKQNENRYRCQTSNRCMELKFVCSTRHGNSPYRCNDNDFDRLCDECFDKKFTPCDFTDYRPSKYPESKTVETAQKHSLSTMMISSSIHTIKQSSSESNEKAWFCNRGISVYVYGTQQQQEEQCLCPPSYYGDRCQRQNERVSLTVKIRKENQYKTWSETFRFVVVLLADDGSIHSYDNFIYSIKSQCIFNIYLLYLHRPKDQTKNYTVRLDGYLLNDLEYHSSWLLSVPYRFMPVNRLAALLLIPSKRPILSRDVCEMDCIHGECVSYVNKAVRYCHCHSGWSGVVCNMSMECQCSLDSICMGMIGNRSICVCPLNKFGSRCLLKRSACETHRCFNGGSCMLGDDRVSSNNFFCVCPPGYSGMRCEIVEREVRLSFDQVKIPSTILLHHIKTSADQHPVRTTLFKRIRVYENELVYRTSLIFDILFVEFDKQIYWTILQQSNNSLEMISGSIKSSNRCSSIGELFNSTFVTWPLLRRVKYYHAPCRADSSLVCLYDGELMCICESAKYTDCFEFDRNVTHNCRGSDFCLNGAECFQDRPDCPSEMICACPECYYGTRCQFTTDLFGHSLDAILGYHVSPKVGFTDQSVTIHVNVAVTSIMFVIGISDGLLALVTFQKDIQTIGCRIYLLTMSVISVLSMIFLLIKFWLFLLIQMVVITELRIIFIYCVSIDVLIRILLSTYNWLSGCVAIERIIMVWHGANFNKTKSKRIAGWVVVILIICIILSCVQESFYHEIIEEPDESRTWCVVSYSVHWLRMVNSTLNIIHFLIPFIINLLSAVFIVALTAGRRATARNDLTYKEHLKSQFRQHKHLFLSPAIFILMNLPNLLLNLLTTCMKSTRDPWPNILSYFASFIPAMLTFVVFVLPSKTYRKQFCRSIKQFFQCEHS